MITYPGLMGWLIAGERGMSSDAIVSALMGMPSRHGVGNYPHDPSDLGRCRKLLEAVPAFRPRLAEMRAVSPEWAALVERWDDLCEMMDREAPNWRSHQGSAPETYALMRSLIDASRQGMCND